MKLKKLMLWAVACIAFGTVAPASFAQSDELSYKEGPVVSVSYIRTEPGKFDEYMQYLATTYKQLMEEQKKAGIIVDYAVYSVSARTERDADVILTTTYANMAALDNLDEKTKAITAKIWGTRQASATASINRGKMRTQVGTELIRRLILK